MSEDKSYAILARSLVHFHRGRTARGLEIPHLSLLEGSCTIFSGANGSGKSTLLELLATRLVPASGELSLLGRPLHRLDASGLARLRRRIGFVEQYPYLFEHLTIDDNVALPLRVAGANPAEISGFVEELIDWIGLRDVRGTPTADLSYGQRKLVSMARAVIARPSLLLLDEPVLGLDQANRERAITLISQFRKMGMTIVIASCDERFNIESRWPVILMKNGFISNDGAVL